MKCLLELLQAAPKVLPFAAAATAIIANAKMVSKLNKVEFA